MFFSIEQVKAARALLKWTQKDLAMQAGLSADQIFNFESGRSRSFEIWEAVHKAFTREGVVFIEGGVKLELPDLTLPAIVYDNYVEVLKDACSVLKKGDECLMHRADDRRSSPEVVKNYRQMITDGIVCKLTICEGNTYLDAPAKHYRWIPEDYFAGGEVEVIYADRYVIHVPGRQDRFICIRNETVAKAHRREFYYWWNKGTPVE
jgi:transcriptional regulator with XRE-family HTH domain